LDIDFTDAILVLESGEYLILDLIVKPIHPNEDRQCWPDPQHLLHRRSICADKTQVQTKRSRKYNGPPPSAHVYQGLPFLFVVNFAQVETKYFKEELFRKHVDWNVVYVTTVSGHSRALHKNVP